MGFLAVATLARAQTNGTWNADASDNWSTASRWTGNTVANGAGAIADFSLFNITATRTITLDTSRIIGTLRLGDTNTTNTYTIARTGANTLTFDSGVVGTNAVLSISATSNGDTISAPVILNSSLDLTNNAVSGKTVTLSGGISASATVRTLTIGGTGAATTNISGALSGTVALVMDNATGTTNLVGNTHTGGTTLTGGTLVLNSSTSLGTATVGTTSFTINGGTFNNLSAGTLTFGNSYTYAWNGNFTFTGSSSIALGTGTITLGNNVQVSVGNNTLNAGGIISGAFALSKAGSGTLTLGGANTFSGGMTLSAGTLNLGNASALGTGTFTIAGGTLNTAGTNLTLSTNNTQLWNGNFTFTGSNSLNLGTGAVTLSANRQVTVTANTLTVGGGIGEASSGLTFTKAGVGTLVLNGNNTYTGATTISGGVLIFGTGAGTVTTAGSFTISANAALGAQGSTGFTNATEWLASNRIVASSAGALA
ncbi:MAG: beta strand repeat-containing protein, partial [Verrucomicrobium sp.]